MASGASAAEKRVVRFGEFELSSPPSQLMRDGEPVHLRPQVMRALTELVERPAEIVSREQLRHAIWHDRRHVEVAGGIKTVIRELRQALDDDPANPSYVETIRGIGYRFVAPEQVERRPLVQVSRQRSRRWGRIWGAVAAMVAVLAGIVALGVISAGEGPSLLMPRVRPADETLELVDVCDRLNDELVRELVEEFADEVSLIHVFADAGDLAMSPRVARYAVDGHLASGTAPASYYVSLELIDRTDNSIVWVGTWDLSEEDLASWPARAARELIQALRLASW